MSSRNDAFAVSTPSVDSGCRPVARLQHVPFKGHLCLAVGIEHQSAVGVGDDQRHVKDVKVVHLNAQDGTGLVLDVLPGWQALAAVAVEDLSGGNRRAVGIQYVFAHECLVRGVRTVGLVLVNERGGAVDVLALATGVVDGGTGQHQEVRVRGPDRRAGRLSSAE